MTMSDVPRFIVLGSGVLCLERHFIRPFFELKTTFQI